MSMPDTIFSPNMPLFFKSQHEADELNEKMDGQPVDVIKKYPDDGGRTTIDDSQRPDVQWRFRIVASQFVT
jgi:dihydroorotase